MRPESAGISGSWTVRDDPGRLPLHVSGSPWMVFERGAVLPSVACCCPWVEWSGCPPICLDDPGRSGTILNKHPSRPAAAGSLSGAKWLLY